MQYQAHAQGDGRPPQSLDFRFNDLVRLHGELERVTELQDLSLPALPPKVTLRSFVFGRFDGTFQDERQEHLQNFLDRLFVALGEKYAGFGDYVDLCEPVGEFLRRATESSVAEEVAGAAAAADAAVLMDNREIIANQNAEYEESLRADALRLVAAAEQAEAEVCERQRHAAEQERLAREAAAAGEDIKRRRAAFEEAHPSPLPGVPAAALRFRSSSGASLMRSFDARAPVSALFEYVVVADWAGAPPRYPERPSFDLRTALPVRSLRECRELDLQAAGLCPSSALVVAVDEADSL